MKRDNSKGFTLVELLAVIAILGIIMLVAIPGVTMLINRSKSDSRDSLEKTLEMAAKSYANGNSQALPKAIGESTLIKAKDLKKTNYLKEDLVDYDKNSCMDDSVVRIYKFADNGYTYTPYLYCEGDEVPDVIVPEDPVVSIVYTDEQGNNIVESSENVNIPLVDIDIKGNSAGSLAIDGYSYAISACYKSAGTCESDDLFIEVYNSGSIDANGSKVVNIHKKLNDYVDITTVSTFKVTVNAYNIAGGVINTSVSSSYLDTTPPTCIYDDSQPTDDYWNNHDRKRMISIKCSDGNGSGCVRDKYVKTFTEEMDSSVITIEDNAGNKTDCPVRVHLDWTAPTVTLKAYKRNADGSKGNLEASIVANEDAPTQTLTKYASGYGTDQWLNVDNFPYGIYYEVSVIDNLSSSSGRWSANQKGQRKDNITDFDYSNEVIDFNFDASNTVHSFYIDKANEGWRKGNITVTDLSGNKVRINVLAALDLEHPLCTNYGEDKNWRKEDLTLYGSCSDGISGCTTETVHKTFTTDINTTTASPGSVEDKAGNKTDCASNQTVKIDKTAPENLVIEMFKATDSSAPTSTSGLDSYSSDTWTNTNVYATASGATDSGSGVKGYYLTSTGAVSQNEEEKNSHYFETDGSSTIYWKVCDNVDNCYTSESKIIKVDKTAPTINSINYKYRSSIFGSNNKCQMVPNPSCDFVDCKGYLPECSDENDASGNNRRLVLKSNTDTCLNVVKNGVYQNGCDDSTVQWSDYITFSNTHNLYLTDYIGDIFSVNGGPANIYLEPETLSVTENTSGVKVKKILVKDDIEPGFQVTDDTYLAYTSDSTATASQELTRWITANNRGTTYKLYVEDNAGNFSTWTVIAKFTGVCVHDNHWKYTPYKYDVVSHLSDPEAYNNPEWAYWAHGWVRRFYIRTFMSEKYSVALTSKTYYSDSNHHILPGSGTCGAAEGCQLEGWFWIDNVRYFFNTGELDITVVPNGSIVEGHWVTACENSSYYLSPPRGGCDTDFVTRWCDNTGSCN